jgi:hypothetical protein
MVKLPIDGSQPQGLTLQRFQPHPWGCLSIIVKRRVGEILERGAITVQHCKGSIVFQVRFKERKLDTE